MSEIKRALRPIRRRLRCIRLLKGIAMGALVGGGLCLILMILSFFMAIRDKLWIGGIVFLAPIVLLGIGNALRPVQASVAARTADAHGLKERVQTALSLPGDSPMEKLQWTDTQRALRDFDAKIIPLPRLRRLFGCTGVVVLLCAVLLVVPNPQNAVIQRAQAFEQSMEAAAERLAEAAEDPDSQLTEKEKQELRKLLSDLSRELRQSDSMLDALLALDEGEKRLEALRDGMAADAMAQMADALQSQGLQALAEALQSGDMQALEDALDGIDAEALENAANQLTGDMQDLMNAAAQGLQSGNLPGVMSALSQLQGATQSSANGQLSSVSQLLDALRAAFGAGMNRQGGGLNEGQSGQGQGNQPGASAGQGNQLGTGAGQGSTNEDQGTSNEQIGISQGGRNPRYQEGEYEQIYDPTRLDVSQTALSAQGTKGEGDSSQIQLGPGIGISGGSIPYNQVVYDYADAATQAADSQNLTAQERKWVADYFAALTEH